MENHYVSSPEGIFKSFFRSETIHHFGGLCLSHITIGLDPAPGATTTAEYKKLIQNQVGFSCGGNPQTSGET